MTIKEWVDKCINGPAGYRSFIEHENLGVYPYDLAKAGAEWILRCLVQSHAKDVLDAVNSKAKERATTKAAQVAAIRVRLGDIAASVYDPDDKSTDDWLLCQTATFFRGVRRVFPVADTIAVSNWHRPCLDTLAAWLWERGVRG